MPRTLVPQPNSDRDRDEVSAYFSKTSGTAHALALRAVRTRTDADDIVQNTYVRIYGEWARWRTLNDQARGSWLRLAVARQIAEYYRKAHVLREIAVAEASPARAQDEIAADARDPDMARAYRQVLAVIASMSSPRRREVAVLHWIAGFERPEVAKALGISQVTVRVHLRDALGDLERAGTAASVRTVLGAAEETA